VHFESSLAILLVAADRAASRASDVMIQASD
jgi:hypothetical protein